MENRLENWVVVVVVKRKKSSQTLTPLPTNVMMMINELVRFLAADLKNYVQSLYHVRQPQE